ARMGKAGCTSPGGGAGAAVVVVVDGGAVVVVVVDVVVTGSVVDTTSCAPLPPSFVARFCCVTSGEVSTNAYVPLPWTAVVTFAETHEPLLLVPVDASVVPGAGALLYVSVFSFQPAAVVETATPF